MIKNNTRNVICMPRNGWMLPCNLVSVFPKLNFFVIRTRSNNILAWMKTNPICSTLMTFKNFNTLNFYSNKARKIFCFGKLLFQHCEIPNSYCRIKRSWYYKIFFRMKLGTHNIMGMSGNYIDTSSTLIIPDSHSLIIWCRKNPW